MEPTVHPEYPDSPDERGERQDLIRTWKNIAFHLEISEREAQYRAKEEGLPVHREPGKRGRVYASRAELDTWLRSRLVAGNASAGDTDGHATESAVAEPRPDDVPADEDVEQIPEAPAASPEPAADNTARKRDLWRWSLAVAGAVAVAVCAWSVGLWISSPARRAAALEVKDRALIVRNAYGVELWRQFFPELQSDSAYAGNQLDHTSYIGYLFPDIRPAVLFIDESIDHVRHPYRLHCYDGAGRERWTFTPHRSVRNAGGSMADPPYIPTELEVFGRGARTLIALASIHYNIDPSPVTLLHPDGSIQAEYWHPGHLRYLAQMDMDGRGENVLLAGGVNNGEHTATIVVLEPKRLPRLSTPAHVSDDRFRILDMPPADERAVILFPRSCVSKGAPYNRVVLLRATSAGFSASVAESYDPNVKYMVAYSFDRNLRVTEVQPTPEYVERHRAMERAGEIDHPYDEAKEIAELKSQVRVRFRGE